MPSRSQSRCPRRSGRRWTPPTMEDEELEESNAWRSEPSRCTLLSGSSKGFDTVCHKVTSAPSRLKPYSRSLSIRLSFFFPVMSIYRSTSLKTQAPSVALQSGTTRPYNAPMAQLCDCTKLLTVGHFPLKPQVPTDQWDGVTPLASPGR